MGPAGLTHARPAVGIGGRVSPQAPNAVQGTSRTAGTLGLGWEGVRTRGDFVAERAEADAEELARMLDREDHLARRHVDHPEPPIPAVCAGVRVYVRARTRARVSE